MDEIPEVQPFEECTAKGCACSDALDDSTVTVDDLKQQIQCWRQKYDECTRKLLELDNSLHQTRQLFSKQHVDDTNNRNQTLKNEVESLEEENKVLKYEKQDQLNSKEKELTELKEHSQQQKHTIDDLEHQLEVAKSKINENTSLLKNAEEKIKNYEEKLKNSTQSSNLTSSTGVSTSEIRNGCKACIKITEELNALESENSKLIKDFEQVNVKNTELTTENDILQSELMLKNQNMEQRNDELITNLTHECEEWKQQCQQKQGIISQLEGDLKKAVSEIDEKSKSLKHAESKIDEKSKLLKHKTEELGEVKISLKKICEDKDSALKLEVILKKKNMEEVTRWTEKYNTLATIKQQMVEQKTKELNSLKLHNNELTDEKEQLAEENNILKSEKLLREQDTEKLTKELNSLKSQNNELTDEKAQLAEENNVLKSEKLMREQDIEKVSIILRTLSYYNYVIHAVLAKVYDTVYAYIETTLNGPA